jgi:hypothetical protein
VADTQFRLRGTDPVSRVFHGIAEQGHYAGRHFLTRQGIYICTPEGEFLASTPPADADSVLAVMQRGLRSSREGLESRVPVASAPEPAPIWEDGYPADGLVLELAVRDLSVPEVASQLSGSGGTATRSSPLPRALNFDYVWLSKREAAQWIPDEPHVGTARWLPDELVTRVACLHLLDSVSCHLPQRFRPEDVDSSWIRTEVVARTGPLLELCITGRTHTHAQDREVLCYANQIETSLLGYATFDVAAASFRRFEAIALGRCTEFRSAGGDSTDMKEIGFGFTLAQPGQPRTPPHFVQRYEAEWLPTIALTHPDE